MDKIGKIKDAAWKFADKLECAVKAVEFGDAPSSAMKCWSLNDTAQLIRYTNWVGEGEFKKAQKMHFSMDTNARDCIPEKIFDFVDNWKEQE